MLQVNGLHIEATTICTLKCPGCARTRFIEQWSKHWKNHSLDASILMQFLDINLHTIPISFCGNYGDPIYHPDFIELIQTFKNRGARIAITTNGSHKTAEWWQSLCETLDQHDCIRFSIDGTPENFDQYRINANWQSIATGISVCAVSPVKLVWKYIPFAYNEKSITAAKDLSRTLGFDDFIVELSDRYDEKTLHFMPTAQYVGNKKVHQDRFKSQQTVTVDPKCANGKEHFITATGHYTPCCYVADHRFYHKTSFGKTKSFYDIRTHTLSEILSTPKTIEFYQNIPKDLPTVCQYNCPNIG